MATLLIVGDYPHMRYLLHFMARDLVGLIYECADASQTVAAYALCQPDWVLLDAELKQTDSLITIHSLRETFPAAKVVVVSKYDDPQRREAARQAGVCAYILKENLLSVRSFLRSQKNGCRSVNA